jgi:hypothetical protein
VLSETQISVVEKFDTFAEMEGVEDMCEGDGIDDDTDTEADVVNSTLFSSHLVIDAHGNSILKCVDLSVLLLPPQATQSLPHHLQPYCNIVDPFDVSMASSISDHVDVSYQWQEVALLDGDIICDINDLTLPSPLPLSTLHQLSMPESSPLSTPPLSPVFSGDSSMVSINDPKPQQLPITPAKCSLKTEVSPLGNKKVTTMQTILAAEDALVQVL